MTTRVRPLRPLMQAQKRRSVLPWYYELSGRALFLLIVLAASLMALLALAQTGRVVTVGYQIRRLEQERQALIWEREALLTEIARATDPGALAAWAEENGLEPLRPGDVVFLPVPTEWPDRLQLPDPVAAEP